MSGQSSIQRLHAETRREWRTWLEENHDKCSAVWLVSWKKSTGRASISYDDAVSEALAFGWIDSRPNKLDNDRTMLYFTPRRHTSAWSRANKLRVDILRRDGLMHASGEYIITQAIQLGSWSLLDQVEDLVIPDDLMKAFDQYPDSRKNWESFPPSARRGILEWIVQAKRAETRQKRIKETATLAQRNERAAQWKRPS
jgi:uncharacterized protein YdeI (YjbR/CyaY-like superfamily)